MYYTIHFYVENDLSENEQEKILMMFDLLSDIFGLSFKYFGYDLFDPDRDGYIGHEKYQYDSKGFSRFRETNLTLKYCGKLGDITAPIIYASDKNNGNQWIGNGYVQCIYPENDRALLIILYGKVKNNDMTIESYIHAIKRLNEIGYHVNNSFVDFFFSERGPFRLTGMEYTSIFSPFENRDRKYRVSHERKSYKNHIRDIYAANSVLYATLGEENIRTLSDLIGEKSIYQVDDSIVFSICKFDSISYLYRLRKNGIIKQIRADLRDIIA